MKTKWISLRRLKEHEFQTTLRYIRETGENWHNVYVRLGQLQSDVTKKVVKLLTTVLVFYLILISFADTENVVVTFYGVTASIPTGFVTVTASLFLFLIAQHFQTFWMVMQTRIREGLRVKLPGFSMNSYGFYHDQDEMALVTPVVLNNFLKPRFGIPSVLSFLSLAVFFAVAFPFLGMWYYLADLQLHILLSEPIGALSQAASVFGLFTLFVTIAFLLLFNVPLPMARNSFAIRWGFLSRLYPVGQHPQLKVWLDSEKTDKK